MLWDIHENQYFYFITIILYQGNEDLIVVHEALEYGDCRLSIAVSWNYMLMKLLDYTPIDFIVLCN